MSDQMTPDEYERIERIDRLAERMLMLAKYDGVPATEVWDMAAEKVDANIQREMLARLEAERS